MAGRAALLCLAWLACATGSDVPGGGGYGLPSMSPGRPVLPENPLVLKLEDARLGHPWGLVDAGGSLRVWLDVGRTDSTSIGLATGQPTAEGGWAFELTDPTVLGAELAWEGAHVSQPSVAEDGGLLLMAYAGGGGAGIGLAISQDGLTWSRGDAPVLEPVDGWEGGELSHPSLVAEPGRILLFYLGADGGGMGVAASTDGGATFERLVAGPVFEPAPEPAPPEDPDAPAPAPPFDTGPLTGASVFPRTTALGRRLYACWYTSGGSLGYAASWDGTAFSRSTANPFLEDPGYDIGSPHRAGDVLLHARNRRKGKPQKGQGLGAAYFR